MAARVAYGSETVSLELPAGVHVEIVAPQPLAAAADPLAVLADALDGPVAGPSLEEAARGAARVALVVPDAARPASTAVTLLPVIARLARAGLDPRGITVLVARGIHPSMGRGEVEVLVGREVMAALRVVQSAPRSPEMNDSIGTDPELGEVRVHRAVAGADLVLLTGAVLPHHLAGFGGGPKALVPGVADEETVLAAHRLTLRTCVTPDGRVRSLAATFDANPFRDALLRVATTMCRCSLLDVVLGDDGGIAAAVAGPVGPAHAAAVEAYRRLRGDLAPRAEADLVIAGAAPPRDASLVQAHKALLAAAAWAKPGAPILWLARAAGGPGHPDFLPWFEVRGLANHLAAVRRQFHPYGLTAYSVRRLAADHPTHVVSEVSPDVLRPMGLLPFPDARRALEHALAHHAVERCVVLPAA
jgi:nickel-dependent lactate racemase